jgi:hypothetical protein
MAYSHTTFQDFLLGEHSVVKSAVSAFEYAAAWEKGGDMDTAMAAITGNAEFNAFKLVLNDDES